MDPLYLFRACYDYFDSQVPNFNLTNIVGVTPFLHYPKKGIKYALGEMRLGLATIFFLNISLYQYLKANTVLYLKKSFFSTLLFYWLFIINCLGLIPKITTYRNFQKLDIRKDNADLRRKMITIFGKRIYKLTTNFTGTSII